MPEAAEVIPPDCLLTFRYNEPKYSVSSFLFPIIFPRDNFFNVIKSWNSLICEPNNSIVIISSAKYISAFKISAFFNCFLKVLPIDLNSY